MSTETRRGTMAEEQEMKVKETPHHLAYPTMRTQAALEKWHGEMTLYLGEKELAHAR